MNTFSAYVFRQVAAPFVLILGAIMALATMTQALSDLDIVTSNRDAAGSFLWITLLALPESAGLILPIALFAAVIFALNRMRVEGEIASVYAAGVSKRRVAGPIIQLAFLAALGHLTLNVLVQPAAFREMRVAMSATRVAAANALFKEGMFEFPTPNVTVYARARGAGGALLDVMIDDARTHTPVTYTARRGYLTAASSGLQLQMFDGQAQRQTQDGTIQLLDFEAYAIPLGQGAKIGDFYNLHASDRYLYELLFPNLARSYDQRNARAFLSEAHGRLSSPLLTLALPLIAVVGLLGGQLQRRGYGRRIGLTIFAGALLRVAAILVQSASVGRPELLGLQYALPLLAIVVSVIALGDKTPKKRRNRRQLKTEPAFAA